MLIEAKADAPIRNPIPVFPVAKLPVAVTIIRVTPLVEDSG